MYCTKCGTLIEQGDSFCAVCGNRVAANPGSNQPNADPQATPVNNYSGSQYTDLKNTANEPYTSNEAAVKGPSNKKGARMFIGVIAVLGMTAVVLYAMINDTFNLRHMCSNKTPVTVSLGDALPSDEADGGVNSPADGGDTTTTSPANVTAPNSADDVIKREAEEIRSVLTKNKWKTSIEGYDATITFMSDGTAVIEVKVKVGFFSVKQNIDAAYSISDKCHMVVKGEYNGSTYGISGQISKESDGKLVVDRDKDMGKVTLTAA